MNMNANDNEPPQKTPHHRSWRDYFGQILSREPQNREELLELLRDAEQRQLLDLHALNMIEGALQVSEMQVSDIMVPRSEIAIVAHDAKPDDFLPLIIESGHSRFPVMNQETDEVIGILLAKDLLRYLFQQKNPSSDTPFNIKSMLRPPVFVPENTRLDRLLQEFRIKHIHMAIVIDEYGSIAGLATIEDVLEQIVGDIEDEYDDLDEDEDFIKKYSDTRYVIKALTPLEDFNQYFDCQMEGFQTIGELIMSRFDHPPKRGEIVTIDQYRFKILHSDGRQIRLLSLLIRKRTLGSASSS
jgi:magnesium and cobalt transporter